jgi:predicted membrane chloride channel (bestrophin family)
MATVLNASCSYERLIAFVYALTHQLRGTDPAADLRRYLSKAEAAELRGMHYIRWRCWTASV